ncbi:unnamed protein product [Urochloa humidicola]
MFHLKVATMGDVVDKRFNNLKPAAPTVTTRSPLQLFDNISHLVDEIGDEARLNNCYFEVPRARVHPPVPVGHVFYRIKNTLPCFNSPTIQEVDAALSKMAGEPVLPGGEPTQPDDALELGNAENVASTQQLQHEDVQHQLQHDGVQHLNTSPTAATCDINITPTPPPTQVCPATPSTINTYANLSGMADLFSTPEQGLLPQPPAAPGKRGRRLKKSPVQIPSLRRSKRQACSRLRHLPVQERANHVLCKRLGYIKDDLTPAEQAIQEFIATFKGLMPQYIVAGLTSMFRLDDDDICRATTALIKHGGPAVVDGLPEALNVD